MMTQADFLGGWAPAACVTWKRQASSDAVPAARTGGGGRAGPPPPARTAPLCSTLALAPDLSFPPSVLWEVLTCQLLSGLPGGHGCRRVPSARAHAGNPTPGEEARPGQLRGFPGVTAPAHPETPTGLTEPQCGFL